MTLAFDGDPAGPSTCGDPDAISADGRRWDLIDASLVVSRAPPGARTSDAPTNGSACYASKTRRTPSRCKPEASVISDRTLDAQP